MSGSSLTFVAIDTESTGTDPHTARVVELGWCVFTDGAPGLAGRALFHPGGPIPPEASEVHGLTDAHVADAPPFATWPRLREMLLSRKLCGYNLLGYDGPLLAAEGRRAFGEEFVVGGLDPLVFVRWHLPELKGKLGVIAAHLGVSLRDAHTAAADARAAGEVLVAMVRRGLIPEDRAEALRVQNEYAYAIAEERERWGYWIYLDRTDRKTLRAGCGRSRGEPLASAAGREYAAWALREHAKALAGHGDRKLPPAAWQVFTKLLGRSTRCGGVLSLTDAEQLRLDVPAAGGAAGLHAGGV